MAAKFQSRKNNDQITIFVLLKTYIQDSCMLKHLQIENYALIEKLDISFDDGLSIITGETGAGKSILVGALSLILGQRADTKVLFDKKRKCIVEGTFYIKDYNLLSIFEQHEIDYDDNTILRREINQQGKSRAFVNDTPVTLNVLKSFSEKLVDIHSQHESLLLNKTYFQFDVIDNFCGHYDLLDKYRAEYLKYISLEKRLNMLIETEKEARANLDYYKFQYEELQKANLEEAKEFEKLESELEILNNASEIKQNLQNAYYLLADSETNILEEINGLKNLIQPLEKFDKRYKDLSRRLQSVYVELKDIGDDLSQASDDVVFDAERTSLLTERLDVLNKLMMKHNVASIDELIDIKEDYKKKTEDIEFLDDEIESLKDQTGQCEQEVYGLGERLSVSRQEKFLVIEKRITGILKNLGMPNARFGIEHNKTDAVNPLGLDSIRFRFSANLGSEMQDISRVASGGEISRLMLSIKSLITENRLLPTIIFDEIDTGVSGEIASKTATIFCDMSKNMQVICITHLPQIASKGKNHFYVYKEVENKQTKTRLKKLDEKERVEEVAKMLGGESLTDSTRKTAKELINIDKTGDN